MPVETGNTLADLDELWPLSGDATSQGDNHLRLIKSVLKAQFPGIDGDGFKIPIVATEAEINFLDGLTENVQAALTSIRASASAAQSALYAPAGTTMMFFQAAAPTGWVQVTTYHDYMLRVVNTAGGGFGGSASPIDFNITHTHTTGSHTLTTDQMPSHSHRGMSGVGTSYPLSGIASAGGGFGGGTPDDNWVTYDTTSAGGGASHNHGATGPSSFSFAPRYLNTILARKS